MTDFREFRRRSTEFAMCALMRPENLAEVQARAFATPNVRLVYRSRNGIQAPIAIEWTDPDDRAATWRAAPGEMAVITNGKLKALAEIEFLREYEPHGHIDWTEPRLQRETLAKHAVEILGRLGAPTTNAQLTAWVANVLSDVRATGSEAESIREGYGWSVRQAEKRADELQDIVNDWRERVRMIKRATVKSPDHMDGDEARTVLREVRKWTRHLRVGRF